MSFGTCTVRNPTITGVSQRTGRSKLISGRGPENAATTQIAGWNLCVDNFNVNGSLLFGQGGSTGAGFWNTPAQSIALATWTHVAVVYDKSSTTNVPTIYIDGTAVTLTELAPVSGTVLSDDTYDLLVGSRPASDRTFDGIIDEARLSTVPRSTGWIATSYRNQLAPTSFVVVGNELRGTNRLVGRP
jgi:hypothetical protein